MSAPETPDLSERRPQPPQPQRPPSAPRQQSAGQQRPPQGYNGPQGGYYSQGDAYSAQTQASDAMVLIDRKLDAIGQQLLFIGRQNQRTHQFQQVIDADNRLSMFISLGLGCAIGAAGVLGYQAWARRATDVVAPLAYPIAAVQAPHAGAAPSAPSQPPQ